MGKPQAVDMLGSDLHEALAAFTLALSKDGELKETDKGANVLSNPLQTNVHLMQALTSQSLYQPLQTNEIVTTGTVTSAFSVEAGQTRRTALEGTGLAGLSVAFTAQVFVVLAAAPLQAQPHAPTQSPPWRSSCSSCSE